MYFPFKLRKEIKQQIDLIIFQAKENMSQDKKDIDRKLVLVRQLFKKKFTTVCSKNAQINKTAN